MSDHNANSGVKAYQAEIDYLNGAGQGICSVSLQRQGSRLNI